MPNWLKSFSYEDLPPRWGVSERPWPLDMLRRLFMPVIRICAWSEYGRSEAVRTEELKGRVKNLRLYQKSKGDGHGEE